MNGCQSYHARLYADFYSAQPNIYSFVETLLQQQTSTYNISLASLSVTASLQKEQHVCNCKLSTARDICPENNTCSMYHTGFLLLEWLIAPLMTLTFDRLLLFCFCMCAFVTKSMRFQKPTIFAFSVSKNVRFALS